MIKFSVVILYWKCSVEFEAHRRNMPKAQQLCNKYLKISTLLVQGEGE